MHYCAAGAAASGAGSRCGLSAGMAAEINAFREVWSPPQTKGQVSSSREMDGNETVSEQ